MRAALGRCAREPLVQFLLAGLLLFLGHRALNPGTGPAGPSSRIELTGDDLRQIRIAWLAQGREELSADQLRSLVEARVREEILYREALALGLDDGDAIVRRRLAQKMEFLFEDVAALRDPTDAELRAWFARHAERFTLPARASFRHLYFSPDRRGAGARDDASAALAKLAGRPADAAEASGLADPFMFQDYYADRSFDELARSLGPDFARALFTLSPGAWSGPLASGYGWHLVWLDSLVPARVPDFEDVAADVRREWLEAERAELRERAFAALRARYEVALPELDDLGPADLASIRAPEAGSGAAR